MSRGDDTELSDKVLSFPQTNVHVWPLRALNMDPERTPGYLIDMLVSAALRGFGYVIDAVTKERTSPIAPHLRVVRGNIVYNARKERKLRGMQQYRLEERRTSDSYYD